MPDWGTRIVDAGGSFHELTKNAFDSLSNKSRQPLNATNEILRESFDKTFGAFRKRASQEFGLDIDEGIDLENISKKILSGVSENVVRFGTEAIGGAILSKIGGAEGPLGLLVTEAITIAGAEFTRAIMGKHSYEPGQWVLLDLGSKPVQINRQAKVIQVSEGHSIWGDDYIDLPDDIDYQEEAHHGIGFIMGVRDTYTWAVFNFANGNEEDFHESKIRPATDALALRLDQNDEFSAVREIKFLKDHDPTLKSYVPTDPGETVWFQGKPYTIVQSSGTEFVIEDRSGTRKCVTLEALTAGKRLTTASWRQGSLSHGSFTSKSPDTLFSGQWVWIPAGKEFVDVVKDKTYRRRMGAVSTQLGGLNERKDILALVEYVDGDRVHLVRAFDGKHITDPIKVVHGVKSDVANTLNHKLTSKLFKKRALDGHDTSVLPMGGTMPALSLGIGAPDLTEYVSADMEAHMRVQEPPNPLQSVIVATDPSGINAENRRVVEAEDLLREITDYDATHGGYKVSYQAPEHSSGGSGSGGTAMFLIAGVVIFIALYGN